MLLEDSAQFLANNYLTNLLLVLRQLHLLEIKVIREVSDHQDYSLLAIYPDLRLADADHTPLVSL